MLIDSQRQPNLENSEYTLNTAQSLRHCLFLSNVPEMSKNASFLIELFPV